MDNDSWILPFAETLVDSLSQLGHVATLVREQGHVATGDICFLLGCVKLMTAKNLAKNTHNLVIHESELPRGKGFAPVAWQILEGENTIPVCLIEASDSVDSGDIWLTDNIVLNGSELNQEWRRLQGEISIRLCEYFVVNFCQLTSEKQQGKESFFERRTEKDSELDINKSISEQFNLLRVVDNNRYPAFFYLNGHKYILKIEREDDLNGLSRSTH